MNKINDEFGSEQNEENQAKSQTENLMTAYSQKYDWLLDMVGSKLSEKRFGHSLAVAETAVTMGLRWGANPEECYVAGVCHDIAKEIPKAEQKEILQHSGFCTDLKLFENPSLWHAPVGALLLKKLAKEHQEITVDVVGACLWHTTGKADMSVLARIIFLADLIEPGRSWQGVEELRKVAATSLNKGIACGIKKNLDYLMKKERYIHPDANAAYEFYKNLD